MHLDLWTLALQAVNAGILIWLLARFLFRPVRAIIEQRQAAAAALLADAATARAKAEADAAEVARRRQGAVADGERILAEAHAQAAAAAETQRTEAVQAINRMRQDVAAELARERTAMHGTLAREAADLAVSIARRLLGRVPGLDVTEALLRDSADRLAHLPDADRLRLTAGHMDVVTPSALNEAQQSAWRERLRRALASPQSPGDPVPCEITFRSDPALLAGVELRAPQMLMRNHWQADLERITHDLHAMAAA
jgi:F-type H+-transporting ATPase subunit b